MPTLRLLQKHYILFTPPSNIITVKHASPIALVRKGQCTVNFQIEPKHSRLAGCGTRSSGSYSFSCNSSDRPHRTATARPPLIEGEIANKTSTTNQYQATNKGDFYNSSHKEHEANSLPSNSMIEKAKENGLLAHSSSPTSIQRQVCDVSTTTTTTSSQHECHHQEQPLETKTEEATKDLVTIIHFNDCYNVEPGPESSGAAGFLTAINEHRHLNPMILFSGDIISPSFMSTFTKGEQMIPVLNDIGVHCAVFGNHEFDYGVDNLIEFTKRTSFPWLLSNVIDKETSNQLGDGLMYHIIERSGLKFGLIGLIEEEWLSTLSTLDSSDVIYEDFVEKGQQLAKWLKSEPNCVDYVIALTHCRTPNDIRLADSVPEIDLILGGHDHDYEVIKRPNCYVVKSGTDFREFSEIKLKINAQYLSETEERRQATTGSDIGCRLRPIVDVEIKRIDCSACCPDESLKQKLEKFVTTIDEKMGQVLGQFNCDLDGRFSSIRRYETNLGNFVTDIMLASTHADLAILNSGTLRSDRVHPKGDFTMRDLFNILGYIDPIAVLQASGHDIWRALENGVSQWPKLEGRFPQISGCSFLFDPNKPPLSRINPKDITIGEEPLVLDKFYKLTTKAYLASGKDGYDVLKDCKILVPGDESPDLTTSILNHFEAINIVKSNRRTHHRQSIICLSRSSLKKLLDQSDSNNTQPQQQQQLTDLNSHNYYANDNNNNNRSSSDQADNFDETVEMAAGEHVDVSCGGAGSVAIGDSNNILGLETTKAPSASSPLVGLSAPTPTLRNMVEGYENGTTSRGSPAIMMSPQTPLSTIQKQPRTKRLMSLYEMEHEQCKLEPKIEGRIRILGVNA